MAALRRGIELGLTHIDTAELYGDGVVEEMVAEAIEGRRDEVFLVSRVMSESATRRGTSVPASARWSASIPAAWTATSCTGPRRPEPRRDVRGVRPSAPSREDPLWGVSNFDVADLEAALPYAGPGGLVCNQVLCHLGERHIKLAVLPWCEPHGSP